MTAGVESVKTELTAARPSNSDSRIIELLDRVILPALLERFLTEHDAHVRSMPLRAGV
jgi:hypothetical protein